MHSKGILYLALGEVYKKLTLHSIRFLRSAGCKENIRVITDISSWEDEFLNFEIIIIKGIKPSKFSSRYYKTQIINYSFDINLFLDSDTIPISSIDRIWNYLDNIDFACAIDLHPNVRHVLEKSINDPERRKAEYEDMHNLGLEDHPYYNSGVMLFKRSPKMFNLFRLWHDEWAKYKHEDQLALIRAITNSDVHVTVMSNVWNYRPRGISSIKEAKDAGIKILHFLSRQRPLLETFLNDATP